MQKRRPMLGMLKFAYYALSASVVLTLLLAFVYGLMALFMKDVFMVNVTTFLFLAIGGMPYVVLIKAGSADKWEQYQLSTPISRGHLAAFWYIKVLIATLLGVPIIAVIWGVGAIVNDFTVYTFVHEWLSPIAYAFGVILIFTALLFPIGSTKLGGKVKEGAFFVSMAASGGIIAALSVAGNTIGLSHVLVSLFIIVVSCVLYIASMFITMRLYAKMDF